MLRPEINADANVCNKNGHRSDNVCPTPTKPATKLDKVHLHSDDELTPRKEHYAEEISDPTIECDPKHRKRKPIRKFKATTHLRLQNHNLRSIPELKTYPKVVVLYLYNNNITSISNLRSLDGLTHLYLGHNKITHLENINHLNHLQKLYVGHNRISVLEGLEGLYNLRELHMPCQRLSDGDSLAFDPRSIQAVSGSLRFLDIQQNNVTSVRPLAPLSFLAELVANDNYLESLVDITETLVQLPTLITLHVKGNPFCELRKHRDALVNSAPALRQLDDHLITDVYRRFLVGKEAAVARRVSAMHQQHKQQSMQQHESPAGLAVISASAEAIGSSGNVGKSIPRAVQSQGSLRPSRLAFFHPRQTSSTHVRVGNMLTLTSRRRMEVRAEPASVDSQSELEAMVETPGGDMMQQNWQSRRGETLPGSPARVPLRATVSEQLPSRADF